jgi:arsenate reductase-like glutaredoxin family protein
VKAWLSRTDAEVEYRDFFTDPFSEDELRKLLGGRPPSEHFSWNSPSRRKLGIDRDETSEDELIALMLQEPRLIRRPIIEIDSELLPPISGSAKIQQALAEVLQ